MEYKLGDLTRYTNIIEKLEPQSRKEWEKLCPMLDEFLYQNLSPYVMKKELKSWTDKEKSDFLSLLNRFGPVHFGLLSLHVPGRTGFECKQFYNELVSKGEIKDLSYNPKTDKIYSEGILITCEGSAKMFLGNTKVAQNLGWLKNNIKTIVNVSEEIQNFYPDDFNYLRVSVSDSPNSKIIKYFDCANQFIHDHITNGRSVLIHCQTGDSRSVTIVLCYLIKYNKFTLKQALDTLKTKGVSNLNLNKGFQNQLMIFEKRVHGKNSFDSTSIGKRKLSSTEPTENYTNLKKKKIK